MVYKFLPRFPAACFLLLRKQTEHELSNPVFCIPKSYVDHIVNMYHNSILGSHQGFQRNFLTIRETFYIPHFIHYIRCVLKGCQTCQPHKWAINPKVL